MSVKKLKVVVYVLIKISKTTTVYLLFFINFDKNELFFNEYFKTNHCFPNNNYNFYKIRDKNTINKPQYKVHKSTWMIFQASKVFIITIIIKKSK